MVLNFCQMTLKYFGRLLQLETNTNYPVDEMLYTNVCPIA